MTVVISRVGPEAADALAATHAACFAKPWTAADFTELMTAPGATAVVVSGEAGVLALILIRAVEDEAEILTVAVRPEARRGGVGRRLVEAAAEIAAEAGAETLWLEVGVDNAAALALYAAAGFEPSGRRKGYYRHAGRAEDALILRRVLNTIAA
ncbi:MAG: ribosomal protein S18-alanine N-acetyltransferase [Caulobacteraceae bacterium]